MKAKKYRFEEIEKIPSFKLLKNSKSDLIDFYGNNRAQFDCEAVKYKRLGSNNPVREQQKLTKKEKKL